jgi:ketosteroid isomerase-like protein
MSTTAEAVMTTQEVANRMSELFKENRWDLVQEELFADNAVSIEPPHSPGLKTVEGKAAIKKKGEDFNSTVEEVHGGHVSDLLVGGNYISCAMGMDVTLKGMGRMKMDEIALYEVKDGKIVREQFFY